MPKVRLAVVDHWVADVVAQHSTADVVDDLGRVGDTWIQTFNE